jgi:hypothetical protein
LSGKFTVLVKPRFLTNHSKTKIKSWENEKVTDFQENIDEEKLFTFEQKLSRWQNEIGVTDQAIIDSLQKIILEVQN